MMDFKDKMPGIKGKMLLGLGPLQTLQFTMQKLFVFTLVVLVALVQADSKKCPKIMGKTPFDESKMAGQWYIQYIHMSKVLGPVKKECAKLEISTLRTDSEMSMTSKVTYKVGNESRTGEAFSKPCKSDNSATFFGVYKKHDDAKWSDVHKKVIIATDYDNYALCLICKPTFDADTKTFGRSLYVDIISRSQTLDSKIVDTLKNIISGYDIDTSLMKKVSHENCSY
ncbi:hypothetical protein B566_EDAN007018 [Ephemera danica]|nr:hypothetical protein B566_EDAN007018 [Ephemera danica]